MRAATSTRRARATALLAVVALHLFGGLLFMRALRATRPLETPNPLSVWLAWSGSEPAVPAPARRTVPAPSRALSVAAPPPNGAPAAAAIAASPGADWRSELRAAAANLIENAARERRRNLSMGATPRSPYPVLPARPAFPWSHQPLGEHYDFDASTGLATLRTRHCVFAIWLILPGFACLPGPVDPEPGQGDLFDRKYASRALELPKSLHEAQQAPP